MEDITPQYTTTYFTVSTQPVNTILSPRVINGVNVHPSKENFRFGNCATIAICQAFDISMNAFRAISKLMKVRYYEDDNDEDGLSFFECKKLINLLSDSCGCTSKYVHNTEKVTYPQMLLLLNKGKYLTMFDIHLSFAENGEVFDSYYYGWASGFKKAKPTGWWKIN